MVLFSVSFGFESINIIEILEQLYAYDPVASELMATQFRNNISMQSTITHVHGSD